MNDRIDREPAAPGDRALIDTLRRELTPEPLSPTRRGALLRRIGERPENDAARGWLPLFVAGAIATTVAAVALVPDPASLDPAGTGAPAESSFSWEGALFSDEVDRFGGADSALPDEYEAIAFLLPDPA